MKKIISITTITLFVLLICFGIAFAEEKKKSSWYIGFGIGTGQLKIEGETMDDEFDYSYIDVGNELGIGYDFWLGKSFNLGIHAEYSKQFYNDSDAPDDTEFASIYLSFSWF